MVEVDGKTNRFMNYDQSHDEINKIYNALAISSRKIEENMYVENLVKFCPSKLARKRAKSPEVHVRNSILEKSSVIILELSKQISIVIKAYYNKL